jgi:hypothetical protein
MHIPTRGRIKWLMSQLTLHSALQCRVVILYLGCVVQRRGLPCNRSNSYVMQPIGGDMKHHEFIETGTERSSLE